MQGYLTKQGHVNFFDWEKRYFVLENNKLTYYESEKLGEAKGVYILDKSSAANEASHGTHRFCIDLQAQRANLGDEMCYSVIFS